MARQLGACVAWSREFWDLFMALSSDACAGAALARTVEYALYESAGLGDQPARHPGAGRPKLLLRRTSPNGWGKHRFKTTSVGPSVE